MSFADKRQLSRGIYPGSLHTKALNMITEFNGNASVLTCKFSPGIRAKPSEQRRAGKSERDGSLFIRAADLQFGTISLSLCTLCSREDDVRGVHSHLHTRVIAYTPRRGYTYKSSSICKFLISVVGYRDGNFNSYGVFKRLLLS